MSETERFYCDICCEWHDLRPFSVLTKRLSPCGHRLNGLTPRHYFRAEPCCGDPADCQERCP